MVVGTTAQGEIDTVSMVIDTLSHTDRRWLLTRVRNEQRVSIERLESGLAQVQRVEMYHKHLPILESRGFIDIDENDVIEYTAPTDLDELSGTFISKLDE